AYIVRENLSSKGFRVQVDDSEEKLGKKIRQSQLDKIPYTLVVGDKEVESGTVAVRSRKEGDLGTLKAQDFLDRLDRENKERTR
ncbi:MAG: His/Gly/Thr/Pro-type tRNA ligase C-terminal domain-containing protein, partial [Saccharofermentanales bacterium]